MDLCILVQLFFFIILVVDTINDASDFPTLTLTLRVLKYIAGRRTYFNIPSIFFKFMNE